MNNQMILPTPDKDPKPDIKTTPRGLGVNRELENPMLIEDKILTL